MLNPVELYCPTAVIAADGSPIREKSIKLAK
jgi:hypothetical protein